MFNPNSSIDSSKFWTMLGSFYQHLPESDKKAIEDYWASLIDTTEAAFFNLFQANVSQYFKHSKGYIEHQSEIYDVIFEDKTGQSRENVKIEYLSLPTNLSVTNGETGTSTYSYRVTAKNSRGETLPTSPQVTISGNSDLSVDANVVSWDAVTGASSYGVYGRTAGNEQLLATVSGGTTYNDDGLDSPSGDFPTKNTAESAYLYPLPDNYDYMSIPTLSGMGSGQILQEGADYEIENMDTIRFNGLPQVSDSNSGVELRDQFLAEQGVSLIPSIMRFYLPAIGMENPKDVVNNTQYEPHLDGYSGLSYLEKQKKYAFHLKQMVYGLVSTLRLEPTITNLRRSYGLLSDFPFSYASGEATDITSDLITISGEDGQWTYQIDGSGHSVSQGDQVEQFQILHSGLELHDYVSSPTTVSGLNPKYGEVTEYDVFIKNNTPNKQKLDVIETLDLPQDSADPQSGQLTYIDKSVL